MSNNKKMTTEDFPKIINCLIDDFSFEAENLIGSEEAYSLAVRVHRQNSRQGTVAAKGRSDLTSRSNKKPWRQKGTGRARAGTPRSPLWRGGAVSHPPRMRTRKLTLSKSVNNSGLRYLISSKFDENNIFKLNWIPNKSCSEANKILKNNGFSEKKIVLFYEIDDFETYYSFANIKNVNLVSYDSPYAYKMGIGKSFVFLEKDRNLFEEMVNKWIN